MQAMQPGGYGFMFFKAFIIVCFAEYVFQFSSKEQLQTGLIFCACIQPVYNAKYAEEMIVAIEHSCGKIIGKMIDVRLYQQKCLWLQCVYSGYHPVSVCLCFDMMQRK